VEAGELLKGTNQVIACFHNFLLFSICIAIITVLGDKSSLWVKIILPKNQ
jgi:hypothetical protein